MYEISSARCQTMFIMRMGWFSPPNDNELTDWTISVAIVESSLRCFCTIFYAKPHNNRTRINFHADRDQTTMALITQKIVYKLLIRQKHLILIHANNV